MSRAVVYFSDYAYIENKNDISVNVIQNIGVLNNVVVASYQEEESWQDYISAFEISELQKKAENYAKPLGDKLDATIESSQGTEPVQKKAVEVKLGGRTLQAK